MSDFQIIDRNRQKTESEVSIKSTVDTSRSQITETTFHQRKMRRVRRSQDLIDAVKQIDIHGDHVMQREIADWVRDQYDKRGGGNIIGLFSRCYLGYPYVDHKMDLAFNIVEHYKPGDVVPPPFNAARALAASDAYAYIEVYEDGDIVPVREDGTV